MVMTDETDGGLVGLDETDVQMKDAASKPVPASPPMSGKGSGFGNARGARAREAEALDGAPPGKMHKAVE